MNVELDRSQLRARAAILRRASRDSRGAVGFEAGLVDGALDKLSFASSAAPQRVVRDALDIAERAGNGFVENGDGVRGEEFLGWRRRPVELGCSQRRVIARQAARLSTAPLAAGSRERNRQGRFRDLNSSPAVYGTYCRDPTNRKAASTTQRVASPAACKTPRVGISERRWRFRVPLSEAALFGVRGNGASTFQSAIALRAKIGERLLAHTYGVSDLPSSSRSRSRSRREQRYRRSCGGSSKAIWTVACSVAASRASNANRAPSST